ncbi:MAG: hypothetical protein ACK4PI_06110 [Tepidisphaerales bacterium]
MGKTRALRTLVVAAATLTLLPAFGCDTTNRMDRELKREADRHRIQLNRTRTELETTQAELEQARKDAAAANARADALARDVADLRGRLVRTENELADTRRRLRQVEDAALAAGVTLPPAAGTPQPR